MRSRRITRSRAGFDAPSLPAGTYRYRIEAGSYTEARNLVLVH